MDKTDPAIRTAEAFFRGTEALCNFADTMILPLLLHILSQTPFQQALFGTYYRMQLWMLALEKLDHSRHSQTVLNATRAIYELLMDLKLLQADPTQAQKFHDFCLIARFESAKSYVAALDADSNYKRPPMPELRRAFVDDPINGAEYARLRKLHWPSKKVLHHWTGMSMPERAKQFGDSEVRRYRDIYATLSWYVHPGSPGSPNVPESFVVTAFTWGHGMIQVLFSEATEIMCQVEPLFKADPKLKDKFEEAKAATGLRLPALPGQV